MRAADCWLHACLSVDVRCANAGSEHYAFLEATRKPKVDNLQDSVLALVGEQEVLGFQVAVDDVVRVAMVHRHQHSLDLATTTKATHGEGQRAR